MARCTRAVATLESTPPLTAESTLAFPTCCRMRSIDWLMIEAGVHSATDITGFGFLGHTIQLANNGYVGIKIKSSSVPLLPRVLEFTAQGLCPGGLYRNRDFYAPSAKAPEDMSADLLDVFHDPQTSGGLLMCVAPGEADRLLTKLMDAGVNQAAIIGEVISEPKGKIVIE